MTAADIWFTLFLLACVLLVVCFLASVASGERSATLKCELDWMRSERDSLRLTLAAMKAILREQARDKDE
jgi:hypothetical protein